MANESDSVADFLNSISEKPDIFAEEKDVAPAESEVEEKPLRFDKDPKVQKYIQKQVDKALKDIQPTATEKFTQDVADINLPDSFVRLVGNDTPEKVQVLKDMSTYFSSLKGEARKEFLADMQAQQEAQARADAEAIEELTSGFEDVEETFGVDLTGNSVAAQKLNAEFRQYLKKIAPKDENGEVKSFPDIPAAFEEFQARRQSRPAATRAKEVASRGLTRSTETETAMPQGRSWKDVDRFFDKLKANN